MSDEMNHFSMGLWLLGLAFAIAVSGSVIGLACARHGMSARHPRRECAGFSWAHCPSVVSVSG